MFQTLESLKQRSPIPWSAAHYWAMSGLEQGHGSGGQVQACAPLAARAVAEHVCPLLTQMELDAHMHTCWPLVRNLPLSPTAHWSTKPERLGNSTLQDLLKSPINTPQLQFLTVSVELPLPKLRCRWQLKISSARFKYWVIFLFTASRRSLFGSTVKSYMH